VWQPDEIQVRRCLRAASFVNWTTRETELNREDPLMKISSDRVPLAEVRDLLRIGSALPFRVLDTHERLLLNEGQVIHDEGQFETLTERGAWAERANVDAERRARATAASPPVVVQLSLFDRWERFLWQFDKLARGLVRHELPGAQLSSFYGDLRALVDRDPDVALFLCARHEDHRFALYPLRHSIHCAVLATLTARQLGWNEARINALGCAALSMNLAILELQATMAEQADPPTKKQLDQVRAHPDAAATLLRSAGVDDEDWLATVGDHHEHNGGGGYPRDKTEVHPGAHVLRSIDVYMAKISPRAKRPGLVPQLAVRQLFQQNPGDPLSMAVIKTLGVHPPGSLVKLHSGEIAVAIRRPAAGTHPLVATLSDRQGRPTGETHRRNTAEAGFGVETPLAPSKEFARILPERVYGLVGG
jgi:HD-GYP domain-containing protein (c-di-GMP phosphodiesterase class II)